MDRLLNDLFSKTRLKISVKMRIGLNSKNDWKALVPVLNRYPLSEVIIHGRTAAQMFKGEIDNGIFEEFSKQLNSPVCYNGNIFSLEQFQTLTEKFPLINRWLLGRGLISNPLLIKEIKTGVKTSENEIRSALELLHGRLFQINSMRLSGSSHILNKMKPYWEYFAATFPERKKGLKKILKSATLETYQQAVNEFFRN
ncbi:MAG TPA: hypothetical protein DC049_20160 [Spirochaetia bacterium]|nr:hypothetical protein [Spirochaetia bacterium]